MIERWVVMVCLLPFSLAFAGEETRVIYVNNTVGQDSFDGLSSKPQGDGKGGPLESIGAAFARVQTSDRIEIANTGIPYRGSHVLTRAGGTAEKPLVINGNGATISGLDVVPAEKWRKLGNGFYETDFYPMSNYLKGYKDIQCWIGTPQIWWLADRPAPNCKSEEELKNTPGGFYWNKPLKKLWVNLPEGNTTGEIKIPVHSTAICICRDFVVVQNLRSMHSWNDGFDTHGPGKNIVFRNCIATDNCGQGFSVHEDNTAYYEDCLAERNASSGSCDVNLCTSIYKRCVFVNNTFEAGIYTTDYSQHTYEDCLIVGNEPFEQIWQRGYSKQTYINCIIAGKPGAAGGILSMESGIVRFEQCTFADFGIFAALPRKMTGHLCLENCLLTRCVKPVFDMPEYSANVKLFNNIYWDVPGIKIAGSLYNAENWAEYAKIYKLDPGSKWRNPQLGGRLNLELPENSPLRAAGLKYGQPVSVGAILPESVWQLYLSTRGQRATPAGVMNVAE